MLLYQAGKQVRLISMVENTRQPVPGRLEHKEYRTATLLRIWWRILRQIIKQITQIIRGDRRLVAIVGLFIIAFIFGLASLFSGSDKPTIDDTSLIPKTVSSGL